jgi:hypothetical protein
MGMTMSDEENESSEDFSLEGETLVDAATRQPVSETPRMTAAAIPGNTQDGPLVSWRQGLSLLFKSLGLVWVCVFLQCQHKQLRSR